MNSRRVKRTLRRQALYSTTSRPKILINMSLIPSVFGNVVPSGDVVSLWGADNTPIIQKMYQSPCHAHKQRKFQCIKCLTSYLSITCSGWAAAYKLFFLWVPFLHKPTEFLKCQLTKFPPKFQNEWGGWKKNIFPYLIIIYINFNKQNYYTYQ